MVANTVKRVYKDHPSENGKLVFVPHVVFIQRISFNDSLHNHTDLRRMKCIPMSPFMRKPVYAICEQQRHRSACISAQSDQCLCCLLPDRIIPLLAISKNSRLWLASEAEQPGLSLSWSETPKTGFLVTRLT